MKGIILAAGRGSRLGAQTQNQPKCLLPLAGQSLLDWQIAALRRAQIDPIALVTGYCADQLVGRADCEFVNADWAQTNMVASLLCANEWLVQQPCIVSYSDIVYHPRIVSALASMPGEIVIAYDRLWEPLWRLRFPDPFSDAESFQYDGLGQLMDIGHKNPAPNQVHGQYMGLFKVQPNGWQRLADLYRSAQNPKLDITALLRMALAQGVSISTCSVSGGWCEVDNENDWLSYQRALEHGAWAHDWRWEE